MWPCECRQEEEQERECECTREQARTVLPSHIRVLCHESAGASARGAYLLLHDAAHVLLEHLGRESLATIRRVDDDRVDAERGAERVVLAHGLFVQLVAGAQRAVDKAHECARGGAVRIAISAAASAAIPSERDRKVRASVLLTVADAALRGGFVGRVRRGFERHDALDVALARERLELELKRQAASSSSSSSRQRSRRRGAAHGGAFGWFAGGSVGCCCLDCCCAEQWLVVGVCLVLVCLCLSK